MVVTGLKPGTLYVFRVRARTAAGYTAYCPKFEFATVEDGTAGRLLRVSLKNMYSPAQCPVRKLELLFT